LISQRFNKQKILTFLREVNIERIKAVFITEKGIFSYNSTSDTVIKKLNSVQESRIEINATDINDNWEAQLMLRTSPSNSLLSH